MAFPPVGPSLRPHPSSLPQDFPILHLDGIVEDSSNILGFSMFNTSHPFYHEFVRSLNMSWRENCEASTYPGPAVSVPPGPHTQALCTQALRGPSELCQFVTRTSGAPSHFLSTCHAASL